MSPLVKVVLIVAVALVVWWVVTSFRNAAGRSDLTFTPVEELSPEVRDTIDAALARGELLPAIQHYRAATGAGSRESKAAVETRRWKTDGDGP
jgi:hypothetical protein